MSSYFRACVPDPESEGLGHRPSGRAVGGYPLEAICAQQVVKVMPPSRRSRGTGSSQDTPGFSLTPSSLLALGNGAHLGF